jgi:hypothetical protein
MLGKLMMCFDMLSAVLVELKDIPVFVERFLGSQP